MIKVVGTEAAAPTSTGAGTNLGNATMVRCYNSGGTARLITVQLADNTAIGTFELNGGSVEYLDKDPTDEVYDNTGNTSFTSVVTSG